jgi:hypothetical protein
MRTNVIAALLATVFSTAVLVWTSPLVSFGVAVAGALSWCVWLDGHPNAEDSVTIR